MHCRFIQQFLWRSVCSCILKVMRQQTIGEVANSITRLWADNFYLKVMLKWKWSSFFWLTVYLSSFLTHSVFVKFISTLGLKTSFQPAQRTQCTQLQMWDDVMYVTLFWVTCLVVFLCTVFVTLLLKPACFCYKSCEIYNLLAKAVRGLEINDK